MVAKVLALIIFLVMFLLIVTEKIERQYVTLGCGAIMLIVVFGICMRSPMKHAAMFLQLLYFFLSFINSPGFYLILCNILYKNLSFHTNISLCPCKKVL